MEKMNDLRDLLKHEVEDLYSAEEQIIDALPAMIDKASNTALKNSLANHLRLTEQHKDRLDQVLQSLSVGYDEENATRKKKFLGLFGGGRQKCKGMEGIIGEGKKMMSADMDPDVMDAALIACAQKVEHYEICGYGTARSYANELGLHQAANLLEMTLNEEYDADDRLTFLAESRINKQAERTGGHLESSVARERAAKQTAKSGVRKRETELEPVASRRQQAEDKTENRVGRGGHPKASSTPRSSAERPATSSSKRTTAKTKTASRSNESGRGSRRGSSSGSSRSR